MGCSLLEVYTLRVRSSDGSLTLSLQHILLGIRSVVGGPNLLQGTL